MIYQKMEIFEEERWLKKLISPSNIFYPNFFTQILYRPILLSSPT